MQDVGILDDVNQSKVAKTRDAIDVSLPTMANSLRLSLLLLALVLTILPAHAIKFELQAYRYPQKKCFWNPAHENTLVIVTANAGPGSGQRTDIEIIDSSPNQNVYLRKKGVKPETRLAVTTHADGEVGVCFYNYIEDGTSSARISVTWFNVRMQVSLSPSTRTKPGSLTWT